MKTYVHVVMGNDYPAAVFRKEESAEEFCVCKKKANKPNERAIYWRHYEFELQD